MVDINMATPEWEARCKRCGKCCHRLEEVDGRFVRHDTLTCEYFDAETRKCTVYQNRFMVNPMCREVIQICVAEWLENGFLPPDCGYANNSS